MDAVEISHLTKRFGEAAALRDITFTIPRGVIFGLLGPNGAGKTTLISILAGTTTPTEGSVRVLGRDVVRERVHVQQSINMVRGFGGVLHGFRTTELLRYYALLYGVSHATAAAERAMRVTGLWEQRSRMVHEFSSGWRQRFFIAKALLNDPQVLLLDEPTVGLDIDVAAHMRALIKELKAQGVTVLLTTHYMLEAQELCDSIALISQGRIVALGTVEELKRLVRKDEAIEIVGSVSAHARARIARLDGVLGILDHAGAVRVLVRSHAAMRGIMRELHESDVSAVRVSDVTLEDTFLKLTQRGLSDE